MELVCTKQLEIVETVEYRYKQVNLEYYLLACETDEACTYGIQINMTSDRGEAETEIIHDVSTSKAGMIDLIKLLYTNSVTPVSARDIVCDCIS